MLIVSRRTVPVFHKAMVSSAPPAIAIISIADAVLVNLPSPFRASGHIAGQTSAFAKPRSATKSTVRGRTRSIDLKVVRSIKGIVKAISAGDEHSSKGKDDSQYGAHLECITLPEVFGYQNNAQQITQDHSKHRERGIIFCRLHRNLKRLTIPDDCITGNNFNSNIEEQCNHTKYKMRELPYTAFF